MKRTPQYAQTGPCWSSNHTRVSRYAVRLVGCDVSAVGVAVDPERLRRREGRERDGVVGATSWLARERGELDDEADFRADRSDEWRGVVYDDGDGASRYGESWGVCDKKSNWQLLVLRLCWLPQVTFAPKRGRTRAPQFP